MSDPILVVDDDHHLLSAFRRQLGDRFDLTTSQSGNDALVLIRSAM